MTRTREENARDLQLEEEAMTEFRISIAQSIRAYGSILVYGATFEEAVKKVDHQFIFDHFEPHGSGDDDFSYSHATDVCLTDWENTETGEGDDDYFLQLPDEQDAVEKAIQETTLEIEKKAFRKAQAYLTQLAAASPLGHEHQGRGASTYNWLVHAAALVLETPHDQEPLP